VSFREAARITCEGDGGWPVLSFDGDYYPDIEISIMDRIVGVMLPEGCKKLKREKVFFFKNKTVRREVILCSDYRGLQLLWTARCCTVQLCLNRVALIYVVLFKPQRTETRSSVQTTLG